MRKWCMQGFLYITKSLKSFAPDRQIRCWKKPAVFHNCCFIITLTKAEGRYWRVFISEFPIWITDARTLSLIELLLTWSVYRCNNETHLVNMPASLLHCEMVTPPTPCFPTAIIPSITKLVVSNVAQVTHLLYFVKKTSCSNCSSGSFIWRIVLCSVMVVSVTAVGNRLWLVRNSPKWPVKQCSDYECVGFTVSKDVVTTI